MRPYFVSFRVDIGDGRQGEGNGTCFFSHRPSASDIRKTQDELCKQFSAKSVAIMFFTELGEDDPEDVSEDTSKDDNVTETIGGTV